jgi:hypothetical protein
MYEMPFRLAALQAGLELRPHTSPPVLERIPGWRRSAYAHTGTDAEPRFDVIRGYLHFFCPSDPKAVAAYVDAPVRDVKANWPADVVEVTVDGVSRSALADDVDALRTSPPDRSVQLLGPYDPYLQLKDREILVPDAANRKSLWPTLGRPGAIAVGGDLVGEWRPRTSGRTLTVETAPWRVLSKAERTDVEKLAAALAEFRGVAFRGVTVAG